MAGLVYCHISGTEMLLFLEAQPKSKRGPFSEVCHPQVVHLGLQAFGALQRKMHYAESGHTLL